MLSHLIILGFLLVSVSTFHQAFESVSPNPRLLSYLRGDTKDVPSLNLQKSDQQKKQECIDTLKNIVRSILTGEMPPSEYMKYIVNSSKDVNDLGNQKGCLAANETRYIILCLSGGVPLAVNIALCAPQICRPWYDYDDLKQPIADFVNQAMSAQVPPGGEPPSVEADDVHFFDTTFTEQYVQWLLNGAFIFFYILTFGYIALVLGVTLYHCIKIRALAKEEPSLATSRNELYSPLTLGDHNDREPCVKKCLLSLSIINSYQTLFKKKRDGDQRDFSVLNFMRFVAMVWFILGNTYMYVLIQPLSNYLSVFDEVKKFGMTIITSSTLASDLFLLMSGFLSTYILCRTTLKSSTGMPLFIWTWLHRAFRIWPLYIAIFWWWEWIVPFFTDGPLWFSYYTTIVQDCTSYFYLHFLFLSNLFPSDYETRCMPWTYYIALDFQLQLLVPLFVWLFMKRHRLGYFALAITYIIMLIISISVIESYHLSYSLLKRKEFFYNKVYDTKPWTRCAPFFIGIVFAWAYYLHRYEGGHSQNRLGQDSNQPPSEETRGCLQKFNTLILEAKLIRYVLNVLGLVLMLLFQLLIYNMNKYPQNWTQASDSFYLLFGKAFYIIGVMFMVYPIMIDEENLLRRFFELSIWEPLSKLCFAAYLIAPLWCYFMAFGSHHSRHYSVWMTALYFIGYLVLSFGFAVVASLLYEQPWNRIQKLFCKTAKVRRSTQAEEEFLSKFESGYGRKSVYKSKDQELQEDV